MNAVVHMVGLLPPEGIRRLAALRSRTGGARPAPRGALDTAQAAERVIARWGGDLCGLLNAMTRAELAVLAAQLGVSGAGRSPELREALWQRGAALERGGAEVSPAVQPRPIVLGGHLVIQAGPRGLYPPSPAWPRPVPRPHPPAPPAGEPETLDELLAAADRAIGVRLGARGRDKGAWGLRAARLVGVVERNEREPDWRGDVEVKTVAIARDPSGWWRVVEDPAIAMLNEPALAKLARTLWLARCGVEAGDATIVSWYLLDWDPEIARLARRDLHDRPKGPAGSATRGLYLHKRFFADAGLLATLNGDPGAAIGEAVSRGGGAPDGSAGGAGVLPRGIDRRARARAGGARVIVDELRIIGSTQTNVVMAAEVVRVAQRALGTRPPAPRKEGLGQLIYPFDRDLAWAAVAYLRTPTRITWDVYRSRATRLEPLYDELVADVRADTRPLVHDRDGISVEVRRVEAFAAGERQIVGTVKNALVDGAARRGLRLHVDPAHPVTRWVVRGDERGELVVSIDLGGGSLSQRGWRRDAGEAPLREHLAAVLLMLCRFDPRRDALVDPMCGSGTIPIEAVLAARSVPRPTPALAGLGLSRPAQPLFPDAAPLVIGCDLDLGVLAAARDNARAAGVADDVTWQRADVTRLDPRTIAEIARERGHAPPQAGVLVANPPYGERLHGADLAELYTAIAETCRRFRGWRAGFLVASPDFERAFLRVIGQPRIKKPLANANLRAYFYLYEL